MSLTGSRDAVRRMGVAKVTPQNLLSQKRNATAITAITAYDYPASGYF
jgi:3-methyl-2-oxobutanoate hydroxymethyltransferase